MSGASGNPSPLIDVALLAHFALAATVSTSAGLAPFDGDADRLRVFAWTFDTARAFRFKRALSLPAHEPAELPCAELGIPSDYGAVVIDFTWKPRER